ncbi:hypothetical protein COCCADRAFT_92109, partial [Bipolaris zeicola 26-R-13]
IPTLPASPTPDFSLTTLTSPYPTLPLPSTLTSCRRIQRLLPLSPLLFSLLLSSST